MLANTYTKGLSVLYVDGMYRKFSDETTLNPKNFPKNTPKVVPKHAGKTRPSGYSIGILQVCFYARLSMKCIMFQNGKMIVESTRLLDAVYKDSANNVCKPWSDNTLHKSVYIFMCMKIYTTGWTLFMSYQLCKPHHSILNLSQNKRLSIVQLSGSGRYDLICLPMP